jgi:gluconokinase
MHTTALHIVRAGMEAIACRFALLADALFMAAPFKTIIATGGALRPSPTWAQIITDALGRPLTLSGAREASSRGAVLLALEATGAIPGIEEAEAPTLETFEPDAERHARYRLALARQQKYYELLIEE